MATPRMTPFTKPPYRRMGHDAPARCRSCFYVVEDLDEPRCPECGREFDPHNPSTYTTKPPFVGWVFWLPGVLTSLLVTGLTTLVLLMMGNWGYALWFGVPIFSATLLGYRVRVGMGILILFCLAPVLAFILALMMMNAAGIFCGFILSGIIIGPVIVGLAVGAVLRNILKSTSFSQRQYLPALLAMLMPIAWGAIEGPPNLANAAEQISTSHIIDAPVAAAWDSIMFYEEVEHTPPLILRIGLAHPVATTGSSQAVGDVKRCLYNKGHITKQITAVEEHKLLAFAVIEQQIGYERDVRLLGGSFTFEPVDDHRTRVTLTTEYEPLLTPRFAWRWGERMAVHTLHDHVLEGMARRAERETRPEAVAMRDGDETDR